MEINNWKEKLDKFIVDNEVPEGARIYVNSVDFDEITSELKKWDVDILGIGGTLKYKNRLIAPIEDINPGEFEYVESVRAIEFGSVSNHAVIDFEYKTRTEEEYQLDWLVYKADQLTNNGQIWVGGDPIRANKFYKGYLINKDKFLPTTKARVSVSELISDFFTWSPKIHDLYLKLYNLSEIAKDVNQSILLVDDDFFDDVVKYMVYPLDTGVTSIEYRGIKFVKEAVETQPEKFEIGDDYFDSLIDNEEKMEEPMTPAQKQVLQNPINFNALGIFFFAPKEFEPKPMFGATPEQQLITILNLFQQGILVEGFYKTIVVNNG